MWHQSGGLPWSYEQKVGDFLKPGVQRLDIKAGQDITVLEDDSFDLVTACQVEFDPVQIARVLRKGGFFVTQQTGGRNRPDAPDYNLENQGPKLEAAGFRMVYSHQAYYFPEPDSELQHRFIMIGKLR